MDVRVRLAAPRSSTASASPRGTADQLLNSFLCLPAHVCLSVLLLVYIGARSAFPLPLFPHSGETPDFVWLALAAPAALGSAAPSLSVLRRSFFPLWRRNRRRGRCCCSYFALVGG